MEVTNPATGQTYTVRAHNARPGDVRSVAAAGRCSYISWRDPNEGAFTASLPAGWQVSGGTVRTTQIEPHDVIHAQSPSGGVQMFMDDPNIAVRQIPGWAPAKARSFPQPGAAASLFSATSPRHPLHRITSKSAIAARPRTFKAESSPARHRT